jgi:hypothetical protein
MATATKTETETAAEVTASAKVVALIVAQVSAAVTTLSKKRQTAEGARAEANRLGLDRKGASQMVALSWLAAFKMDTAPDKERNAFLLKSRPDVSKVIALAYPAKPAELAKAYAHNDKLGATSPKANRIGENNLLEIARGNITCADALSNKARVKVQSKLDATMTPAERFANSVAGILAMHKIGEKDRLNIDEAKQAFETAIKAYANKSKSKTPAPKAEK